MKRAYVLKHAPFEGPGQIAPLLTERGFLVETIESYRGVALPSDPSSDALWVVMGGPMSANDRDRPELSYLRSEFALLERLIARDAPVLGICLGAQLMAAAAGARVRPMVADNGARLYEVGWSPVRLHVAPSDPLLEGMPENATVLHWHGETFELPSGARRFASTTVCANQAFQLGTRGVGLQFHCEVQTDGVDGFVDADQEFIERANGVGSQARIREDTRRYMPAFSRLGRRLLENILDVIVA
jgi:GMP synthase-like glutamine amidotransferase